MDEVVPAKERIITDITVIIPLYNGERFITETLDSLAWQTRPVAEIIVVDDGSTDRGAELAEGHSCAPTVVRRPNGGVAVARNHGAALANSPFVAFLDQDDLWLPHRSARLSRYLEDRTDSRALVTTERSFFLASDATVLAEMDEMLHLGSDFPAIESIDAIRDLSADDGGLPAVLRTIGTRELLGGTVTVTTSYVFHRDTLLQVGGFATFARSLDDYWALLNLSRVVDLVALDEPSVLYRIHPGSTTMSTAWSLPLLTSLIAARYGGNLVPLPLARDTNAVVPLDDERGFWRHQLRGLTESGTIDDLLDALAVIRLLGCSPHERRRLSLEQCRGTLGANLRIRGWRSGPKR